MCSEAGELLQYVARSTRRTEKRATKHNCEICDQVDSAANAETSQSNRFPIRTFWVNGATFSFFTSVQEVVLPRNVYCIDLF